MPSFATILAGLDVLPLYSSSTLQGLFSSFNLGISKYFSPVPRRFKLSTCSGVPLTFSNIFDRSTTASK